MLASIGSYSASGNRVGVYLALMDDRYPSTDEEQSVDLAFAYPDARADLNRWLPPVKWLLAIPHYVVLFFLYVGVFFAAIAAWFAILFTGRYPRGIFAYIEGVMRWHDRVLAYAVILITDVYPPFRLAPDLPLLPGRLAACALERAAPASGLIWQARSRALGILPQLPAWPAQVPKPWRRADLTPGPASDRYEHRRRSQRSAQPIWW